MKAIIFAIFMMINFSSFAGETTTDCPMMKEQNERNNPKSNLATQKSKPRQIKGASAQ
jgi:hypothetical protein